MQDGQHFLSTGVMASFRNLASHMPADKLVPEQLSELDCLNILGLISYLLERMEGAEITRIDMDIQK